MDGLIDRWRESDRRSRDRRRAREDRRPGSVRRQLERVGFVVAAVGILGAAVALTAPHTADSFRAVAPSSAQPPALLTDFELAAAKPERKREPKPELIPSANALRSAKAFAAERGGLVSFATIDSKGRLRGEDMDRLYSAASAVKAMVLAAELWRLDHERSPIDEGTDSLLSSMIRYSDNEAADAVYARVGDAGMHDVAKRAGMTGFEIAGHWGNAQITAGDMARFFADLEDMFPRRHVGYAQRLLASVISSQSWGIPVAAGEDWAPRFKGGWLPDKALVHQAAELRERGGPRQISIAILTDEQPSYSYGVETVEGVAKRLLD